MKKMDYLIIVSFILVFLFASFLIVRKAPKSKTSKSLQDTVKVIPDTPVSVKNKKVLYIGDSHTANHVFGWQVLVSKQTGMEMTNTAVGGKTIPWMLETAKYHLTKKYDYCFVYGGANDCYGNINPNITLVYIQKIVDLCSEKGVKCFVLTGFDPLTCVKTNSNYPKVYSKLQNLMLTKLTKCQVIDCRKAVVRKNCWDWVCHMNQDGHKAIADCVIKAANLKKIK